MVEYLKYERDMFPHEVYFHLLSDGNKFVFLNSEKAIDKGQKSIQKNSFYDFIYPKGWDDGFFSIYSKKDWNIELEKFSKSHQNMKNNGMLKIRGYGNPIQLEHEFLPLAKLSNEKDSIKELNLSRLLFFTKYKLLIFCREGGTVTSIAPIFRYRCEVNNFLIDQNAYITIMKQYNKIPWLNDSSHIVEWLYENNPEKSD